MKNLSLLAQLFIEEHMVALMKEAVEGREPYFLDKECDILRAVAATLSLLKLITTEEHDAIYTFAGDLFSHGLRTR